MSNIVLNNGDGVTVLDSTNTKAVPIDGEGRGIVNTYEDIANIRNPYLYMRVIVRNDSQDGTHLKGEYIITNLTNIGKVDVTGIKSFKEYVAESDPNVPAHVKAITQQNITDWNGKQDAISSTNTLSPNNIKDTTMNGKIAAYNNSGVLGSSGIDTANIAVKSEMSIADGTGADAGTATIQLKSGTSKKVLTQHQSLDGKVDKISGKGLSTNDYDNTEKGKVANAIQMPSGATTDKVLGYVNNAVAWVEKPSNGKSAYEMWYEENEYDDPTTYNEDYFLASLKAQFGEYTTADYGTDGMPNDGTNDIAAADANHNKIYIVPNAASSPTSNVMWVSVSDGNNGYMWVSLGEVNVSGKFASNQELKNVNIVQDLNTGGAGNVLSAEAGAALNSRVTSVEDKFEHQGYVFDAISDTDFVVVNVYPNEMGSWTHNYGAYGKYIQVSPGEVIRLTRQNYGGFFAILTSSETFTEGDTPAFAEGWNGRQSTAAITGTETGGYGDITMPEDAAYFYVSVKSTGATTPLQDVIVSKRREVTVPGIDTEVEQLETQIAELPNKIVSETQDVPYTLETSTGCVNGETGADLTASLWTRTEFVDVSELKGKSISFLGRIMSSSMKVGFAFYSEGNTTSVVSCTIYDIDTTLSESVNKWYEVVVPQNANYFRASVFNEIKEDFGIKTKSALVELIEEVAGADATISNGITHLRPDNQGQLNAVKRMRKLTDIEWVPAFDIARGSTAGGRSFYNNKFLAGRRYKGIPYARADKSKYGYTDANTKGSGNNGSNFKVGLRIGLETFMTAICNRGTVMEIESVYSYGLHQAAFYANICAGGVSAALHIDYLTSSNFGASNPPSGFTHIGVVNDPNFSLKSLKLGDVLVNPTEHTAMVTDVIIQNDEVVFVEVGENTTQGNGNYTIEGYEFGGLARRLWWNVSDFMRVWGSYKVRRYNNIANVPYIPSPYVPMPDENYGYARYTMAVLPYMGNNFKYMIVDGVVPEGCRKLIVEEPSTGVVDANGGTTGTPVVFWNKKIDGEWVAQTPIEIDYTSYDANSHPYVYVPLPSDMGVGEYEAYISIKYDDATTRNSTKCYWQVVDSLPLLEDF